MIANMNLQKKSQFSIFNVRMCTLRSRKEKEEENETEMEKEEERGKEAPE